MKVFTVRPQGFRSCTFKDIDSLFEEIKALLEDACDDDRFIIDVGEMTEEKFEKLSDFKGY